MGIHDELDHRLRGRIDLLLESGWQPADLAHLAKRRCTQRHVRLMIGLLARHARQHDAPSRAPQEWLDQLAELGAFDPKANAVVGGHGIVVERWARAEQLDLDEAVHLAAELAMVVNSAGRLHALVPPPSAWGATNRGTRPAAAPTAVDPKTLRTVRALLAKAEGTEFEAEAEAFTAKAQELMARHSIDAAMLAAHAAGVGATAGIASRRLHIDNPYADEKAVFLATLADVNGVKCVWSSDAGFSTLMGYPVDVQLTEMLFTSLLVQATHASGVATSRDRSLRTASFRRAFLVSFADRIGERLQEATRTVRTEAAVEYGSSLAPVLAAKEAAVEAAYTAAFPRTTTMKSRRYDAEGWYAGRAAADRADIGAGAAITEG